ncbi:MAG: hypothetical protein H7Z76_01145, partial [Methylotenera sp.]|nr:hypothetical protein [Flavobacterium sp.]
MKRTILSMLFLASLFSCENDSKSSIQTTSVVLANQSVTQVLIKEQSGFENVELFSLITLDDVLAGSPNFVFGGSSDGSGLLKNADGTFTFLVNHEDNF